MSAKDTLNQWLKTIKKAQCFPTPTKVYVPTCYGKCMNDVQKLITDLTIIYKGSTVYDAIGTWFNPQLKELETEPIKVVEVAGRCTDKAKSEKFAAAILDYSNKAQQQSLAVNRQEFFIARTPQIAKAFAKAERRKTFG